MARNASCVCPFCGCYYDHDQLIDLYDMAERGQVSETILFVALREFREKVLAQAGNAEPVAPRRG